MKEVKGEVKGEREEREGGGGGGSRGEGREQGS